MQRKNCILRGATSKVKYRNGIAMIMAILVIVIISTILALSLKLTLNTSKKTTDLYFYEQAAILSHAAAEYAMLRMSQANPCSLSSINYSYNNTYDINSSMTYVTTVGSSCESNATANLVQFSNTNHPDSDGTVILDITVSTQAGVSTEPIRYFRRSIQKL